MVHEARIALRYLKKFKIDCELIDLRVIKPLDWKTIEKSVKKTGNLLMDTGSDTLSFASEIISPYL